MTVNSHLNDIKIILRYITSGLINSVIGFFIIFTALDLGYSSVYANFFGYGIALILSFIFSKKLIFKSKDKCFFFFNTE